MQPVGEYIWTYYDTKNVAQARTLMERLLTRVEPLEPG